VSRKFRDFMRDVEAEARREGPQAVAELKAFDAHFRLAGELLALRKARGLTQRELAARSGIQQSEISRIESANGNPTFQTITVLASALGADFRLVPSRQRRSTRVSAPSASLRAASRRVQQR